MSGDPVADLIYAILTMDSYNRGYGGGIKDLPNSGNIGVWEILPDSESRPAIVGGFDAGFYAIAYKNGADTVIAYRGTDVKGLNSSTTMGGSDPGSGDTLLNP